MVQIEDLIDIAIEKGASDIHLLCGIKPMLRIIRKLEPIEKYEELKEEDMFEIYDFLIRGNLDKDNIFKTTKKLDTSYEYKDVRLRVNISLSNELLNGATIEITYQITVKNDSEYNSGKIVFKTREQLKDGPAQYSNQCNKKVKVCGVEH